MMFTMALSCMEESEVEAQKIPLFIAALSTNEEGHPIYMNFNVVKGFHLSEVARWLKKHLAEGSIVGLLVLQRFVKRNVSTLVLLLAAALKRH